MDAEETQPLVMEHSIEDNITPIWQRRLPDGTSYIKSTRSQAQRFLTSKTGHYAVLLLVAFDVSCIFADFLVGIFACEQSCRSGQEANNTLSDAQEYLGLISLIFSCLFVVELIISIWAFGIRYFKTWFHCFDATVIVASFVIDVCLKGIVEEAGSIVVVLRLWRVFKIIEEFSAGAEDQISELLERIEYLEKENKQMKERLRRLE